MLKLGIHLPHAGEQAAPALIRRHAIRAEALGFEDVWVSEHIIVPRADFPRSPLFYDPVVTLSYVAAVTERVKLGTTVLVLPMRHPLPLAKELASLHNLSNGRLILGAGVGWLEPEFAALGVPFKERGRRMDEGIAMMRAAWHDDPISFEARVIPAEIHEMRMQPPPCTPIPIWIGGSSEPALARAARMDGWHGSSRSTPDELDAIIARLRRERPEPGYTISMRIRFDNDAVAMREKLAGLEEAGVQHVLIEPMERELEAWLRATEQVGKLAA